MQAEKPQFSEEYIPLDLTKEEFEAWVAHPVTKEMWKVLASRRQAAVERMSLGSSLYDDPGVTAQATARIVGLIEGYDEFLYLDSGTLFDDEGSEEKHG